MNNIPLTNADIITGVSMMLLFVFAGQVLAAFSGWLNGSRWVESANLWFDFGFKLGFVTLLIAHITFDIPYVILSVLPKIRQLDPNLAEAALDLGATRMTAFRKVVLPELMPGIINGALIAFTMCIDDFVISYFTAGSQVSTLSMVVYSMVRRRVSPEINALSTLMFVVVLVLMVVINLRQARQEAARPREAVPHRGHDPFPVCLVTAAPGLVIDSPQNYRKETKKEIEKNSGTHPEPDLRGRAAVRMRRHPADDRLHRPADPAEATGGEVNVYNWGEYIDESVLTDFEAATGIKVNYQMYDSNETMYSKVAGGGAEYDVVIPSDYMIARMIEEDMLEPLNFDNIPNFADIDPDPEKPGLRPGEPVLRALHVGHCWASSTTRPWWMRLIWAAGT